MQMCIAKTNKGFAFLTRLTKAIAGLCMLCLFTSCDQLWSAASDFLSREPLNAAIGFCGDWQEPMGLCGSLDADVVWPEGMQDYDLELFSRGDLHIVVQTNVGFRETQAKTTTENCAYVLIHAPKKRNMASLLMLTKSEASDLVSSYKPIWSYKNTSSCKLDHRLKRD